MADSSTAVVLLDTDLYHAMRTLTHSDCTVPVHQGRPDRPYEPQTVREASQARSMSEAVNNKVRPDTGDYLFLMVTSHPIALSYGKLLPHRSPLMLKSHPIALFLMVTSHPSLLFSWSTLTPSLFLSW